MSAASAGGALSSEPLPHEVPVASGAGVVVRRVRAGAGARVEAGVQDEAGTEAGVQGEGRGVPAGEGEAGVESEAGAQGEGRDVVAGQGEGGVQAGAAGGAEGQGNAGVEGEAGAQGEGGAGGPDAGGGRDVGALAEVLLDCVAGGASVGFLHPLSRARAEAFWREALVAAGRGERIVFVAEEPSTGAVVGTVQLVLAAPENQPHRGEIAKMLVHRRARRRGVGAALLRAAEAAAVEAGKTLLVLDTASPDAERLYQWLGWQRVGVIPGYALWPDGDPVDTTVLYRDLAPPRGFTPGSQATS